MGNQMPDICCFELFIWPVVIKINYPFNADFSQSYSFFFRTKDTVIQKRAKTVCLEKAEQTIPQCILTWS